LSEGGRRYISNDIYQSDAPLQTAKLFKNGCSRPRFVR